MLEAIHVQATVGDLEAGDGNVTANPVYHALRRATGDEWIVYSTEAVRLSDRARVSLPLEVQHFLWASFKRLRPLPCISFTVYAPAKSGRPVVMEAAT